MSLSFILIFWQSRKTKKRVTFYDQNDFSEEGAAGVDLDVQELVVFEQEVRAQCWTSRI